MRRVKLAALLVLVGLIIFAAAVIYLLGPKNDLSTEKVDFVISAGQSRSEISQALAKDSLVRSSFAFYLYLKIIGGKILPGTYELASSQSGSEIAGILATGRLKVAKITIIEGWRSNQIETYLVTDKKLSQFKGFTAAAEPYEGYLFPDTYEIKVDETTAELIELMRQTFNQKTSKLKITPETVILASIVEREAAADDERADIAGVYANRVKIGMKLESDPTVQYAKGSWAALNYGDTRSVESPYNTYLNVGWPPGPICSPGLKSLEASSAPASSGYYYFFHAKGQTYFSKTLAEHQSKVRLYLQ